VLLRRIDRRCGRFEEDVLQDVACVVGIAEQAACAANDRVAVLAIELLDHARTSVVMMGSERSASGSSSDAGASW